MIQQPIPLRDEFIDKVKNFCLLNKIEWGVVANFCWVEGVSGTPEQVMLVIDYVDELENNRIKLKNMKKYYYKNKK